MAHVSSMLVVSDDGDEPLTVSVIPATDSGITLMDIRVKGTSFVLSVFDRAPDQDIDLLITSLRAMADALVTVRARKGVGASEG